MDYQIKVAVTGHFNSGKTSLVHRLCEKNCPSDHYESESRVTTVGIGFYPKQIDIFLDTLSVNMLSTRLRVNLFVWDTNGSEKYLSITKPYFRDNAIVVVVFDVTSRESFEQVDFWRNQVLETNATTHKWEELPLFCLVGCKADLTAEDCISDKEIQDKALEWQCPWWKMSCTESYHMRGTRTEYIAKLQPHSTRVEMMTNYQHFLRDAPMLPTEQATTIFAEMTVRFHKLLKKSDVRQLSRTCCSLGKIDKGIVDLEDGRSRDKKVGIQVHEQKRYSNCC
jgi:GTPase SAR1 family protein